MNHRNISFHRRALRKTFGYPEKKWKATTEAACSKALSFEKQNPEMATTPDFFDQTQTKKI